MRDGFREVISGWTLIHDVEAIGDRIELVADWEIENGPLEEDERATVQLMIHTQVAWGIRLGYFEPFISADTDDETIRKILNSGARPDR